MKISIGACLAAPAGAGAPSDAASARADLCGSEIAGQAEGAGQTEGALHGTADLGSYNFV